MDAARTALSDALEQARQDRARAIDAGDAADATSGTRSLLADADLSYRYGYSYSYDDLRNWLTPSPTHGSVGDPTYAPTRPPTRLPTTVPPSSAPTPCPSAAPTPRPSLPGVEVTVDSAVVLGAVDPNAFNMDPAAILAFRRSVAATVALVDDAESVVDVLATAYGGRRRRLADSPAAARIDFSLVIAYSDAVGAVAAGEAAAADAADQLAAAVADGGATGFATALAAAAAEADSAALAAAAVDSAASTAVIAAETAADVSVLTAAPTAYEYVDSCACLPASPTKERAAAAGDACLRVCSPSDGRDAPPPTAPPTFNL